MKTPMPVVPLGSTTRLTFTHQGQEFRARIHLIDDYFGEPTAWGYVKGKLFRWKVSEMERTDA